MNIAHSLSQSRPTWKLAAVLALLAALLAFYPPALTLAQSPPAAPDTVTATRSTSNGNEQLAVSWSAVQGADAYHVNISGNGKQSWTRILSDVTGTSATIDKNLNSGVTYHIAVAAVKSGVTGGWTNSAAVPPLNPPPSPPETPSSVTLTRADGSVTADWPDMSGATKYHVTYSTDNRNSWHLATSERPYSNITINGTDNTKTYIVAVRAGNAAGWSGWRNSEPAGPYTPPTPPPSAPASVTVTRADGTVTASGYAVSGATKYHITYSSNDKRTWTAASDSHTGSSITISGADNSKTYYVAVRAGSAVGWSNWTNSAAAGPYTPPSISAPSNLSIQKGDGYIDISWDAVTGATGYDVRAKTGNGNSWSSLASDITTTSYRYTTSAVVNAVAVRASNDNGDSAWTELSLTPSGEWLNTVQSGGASPQSSLQSMSMASGQSVSKASANGQSQLSAPASITVTRDNNPRDEKLHVTWAAVSGATGYNLACDASPTTAPMTSQTWWHCGSITSGSTTTFTVDQDKRRGDTKDLSWGRSYTVAVRAVTGTPADASTWTMSTDAHPAFVPERPSMTVSRAAGSISVSWKRLTYSQGYKVRCATRENNVTGAYTTCADISSATAVNGRYTATISSWTDDGTDYTIDDAKTYDVSIRHTNTWGESPGMLAPLIYPSVQLTVSNIATTGATLNIARHTGNWYYKANTGPHASCSAAQSGTTATLSGLTAGTSYTYEAYSDSGCTTANLLATATAFTTLAGTLTTSNVGVTTARLTMGIHTGPWWYKANAAPHNTCQGPVAANTATRDLTGLNGNTSYIYSAYSDSGCTTLLATAAAFTTTSSVSNLNLTANGPGSGFGVVEDYPQAQAFTTGSNAGGYTLGSVTVHLRRAGGSATSPQMALYSASSDAPGTSLTTLSVPPSNVIAESTYTFTCNNNCELDKDTTYFVVLSTSADRADFRWYQNSSGNETKNPSNNGWSLADNSLWQNGNGGAWTPENPSVVKLTEIGFENRALPTTLSAGSIGTSDAVLTIANHTGNWYYKANAAPHTACSSAQLGTTATLTGLTGGTSYTYSAYSDSNCSTLLVTAAAFTTTSGVSNLTNTGDGFVNLVQSDKPLAVAFTTGSNTGGYTLNSITTKAKRNSGTGNLNVLVYTLRDSGTYGTKSAPATTATVQLTGDGPTTSTLTDSKYTCSGSRCDLAASTTYFVVLSAPSGSEFDWASTQDASENVNPSNSGWQLEHSHIKDTNTGFWYVITSDPYYQQVSLEFTTNP